MEPLSSVARGKLMVHDGEKRRKSMVRTRDGMRWNPRSDGEFLVLGKAGFF